MIARTLAIIGLVGSVMLAGSIQDAWAATTVLQSGATQVSIDSDTHGGFGCALLEAGVVECWGNNSVGELGDGSTNFSPGLVRVSGLTGVQSISAGGAHVCALIVGGTVKCWGRDQDGELGNGTMAPYISTPVTVSGINSATGISAGDGRSCAVLADGTARCWGGNAYGTLGDGTENQSSVPVTASGLGNVAEISAGSKQTCALLQSGSTSCWGANGFDGNLGNGTEAGSTTPVGVSGISQATGLSSSASTCATLFDGSVRCWGWNGEGELGNGSVARTLTPVTVSGMTGARQVSSGVGHACAILGDGSVRCWGANLAGQLGDGTNLSSSAPVKANIGGVIAIDAGIESTCAVLVGGAVECWGAGYGPLEAVPPAGNPGSGSTGPGNSTAGAVTKTGPPSVRITSHPPKETADQTASFGFVGVMGGSYECLIDARSWKPCRSGDSFGPLRPGDHRFEVREILGGVTGPADSFSWTVDLPKACVLKVARARVLAFTHQSKARLVIHYKAYAPAQVTVSYSLKGSKGALSLGSATSRFKTAGIFRAGEKLGKAQLAKLRATSSMTVKFRIPQAPSSCTRYYTKHLTIPKTVFGQTVWFQSDSIFGPHGS